MQIIKKTAQSVLRKLGIQGFSEVGMWKNETVLQIFTSFVTVQQLEALQKASNFKWQFQKIKWNTSAGKCAVLLFASGTFMWVLPNASMVRTYGREYMKALPDNWDI